MSVLNQSGDEQVECPLCMEPLEVDDLNFFPCTCGYQICRFCWHRIRTDENGLCPACRKAYPEDPADFKPLTQEEIAKLKAEKRQRDSRRKNKLTEGRRHLANVRVVQSNLVFVVGLPLRLADAEVLKKYDYFGKYGKIHKVVINQSTSYAGSQGPSASAYVTYSRAEEALRAIQAVSSVVMDGRALKASLGTTKYCAHFMKGSSCPKPDCMYLHELGDREASFTKEEMQQGKHTDYERKLHEQLNISSAPTSTAPLSNHLTSSSPSPSSASPSSSSSSSSSISISSGSSSNSSIPPTSLTHNHINCKEGKKLGGSSCSPPSHSLQQQNIQCLGAAPNILSQHHPPHQNSQQQQSAAWSSNGNGNTNVIIAGNGGERVAGSGSSRRGGKGGGNGSNSNVNSQRRRHTSGDDVPKGKNREKLQSNGTSNSGSRGSKGGPSPSPPLSSSAPRKVNSTGNGAPVRGSSSNSGSLPSSLAARYQSGKCGQSSHAQNPSQDVGRDDLQEDAILNQDLQNEVQLQDTQQTGNQLQGGALKGALSGLALSPRLMQWRMGAALFGAPEQDNNSFFSNHHCFPTRSALRPHAAATSPRDSVDGVGSSAGPGASHPSDETSLHSSPPSSPSPSPSSSSSASSPTSSSPSVALLPNGIGSSSVATSLGSNEWVSGVGNSLEGGPAIPDALPTIHSTTDWQAAFGFSNSQPRSTVDLDRRSRPELGPLGHGLEGLGMPRSHSDADVVNAMPSGMNNSLRGPHHHTSCGPLTGGRSVDDDLGFDPFHETQKALAEMMEKEDQQMLRSQQQNEMEVGPQCLHMNDIHRDIQRDQLSSMASVHHHTQNFPPHHIRHPVGGGLSDGTPLTSSSVAPKQTQPIHTPMAPHIQRGVPLPGTGGGHTGPPLPPPGFSAPNHMNAFGLGIPRPPSGAGSKILPFMGLGSAASSSVAIQGPPSPTLPGGVSGGTAFGSIMCNGPNPPAAPNGSSSNCPSSPHAPLSKGEARKMGDGGAFNMREFHVGLRAILPGLGMPKGMCQHPQPVQQQQQQQDWTTLDPAIVSSTPHLHNSHSTGSLNLAHSHWAKSLEALSTIPPLTQPSSASSSQIPSSSSDHHYYRGLGHFQDFGGGWPTQMGGGVHLSSIALGGPGRYQPNHLQMQPQQQQPQLGTPGLMGGHQVHQHPYLIRPQDVGNSGQSAAAPPPGFNPLRSSKTVPEVAGMENL